MRRLAMSLVPPRANGTSWSTSLDSLTWPQSTQVYAPAINTSSRTRIHCPPRILAVAPAVTSSMRSLATGAFSLGLRVVNFMGWWHPIHLMATANGCRLPAAGLRYPGLALHTATLRRRARHLISHHHHKRLTGAT